MAARPRTRSLAPTQSSIARRRCASASLSWRLAWRVVINRVHAAAACCRKLAEQVIFVLIPPLALIFLVLGTIFLGVATPTEGGAMGAIGALILALMQAPR